MKVEQVMLSMIRSEVCGFSPENYGETAWSTDAYEALFALSAKHDMAHIVASALSKGNGKETGEVFCRFQKKLMLAVYRDGQKEYAVKETGEVLEKAGICHILLKGAVVCKYYPQTWMRTSSDIDILIRPEDAEKAIEALCEAGFSRLDDTSTHDYNFKTPGGVHLELHYTLTQGERLSAADELLNSVWEEALPEEGFSYRYKMKNETFVLYHLAHMGRHFLHGGCGVRPFVDLFLIRGRMPLDEKKLNSMLEKAKLMTFYKSALALSEVWFGEKSHGETTKQMEDFILTGGVFGTADNHARMNAASGDGKVRSFLKVMFLPRENLAVLYPNLRNRAYLTPFYQVKRWFRILRKDKRDKIKRMTKVRNLVSEEEKNAAENLLDRLGLI